MTPGLNWTEFPIWDLNNLCSLWLLSIYLVKSTSGEMAPKGRQVQSLPWCQRAHGFPQRSPQYKTIYEEVTQSHTAAAAAAGGVCVCVCACALAHAWSLRLMSNVLLNHMLTRFRGKIFHWTWSLLLAKPRDLSTPTFPRWISVMCTMPGFSEGSWDLHSAGLHQPSQP